MIYLMAESGSIQISLCLLTVHDKTYRYLDISVFAVSYDYLPNAITASHITKCITDIFKGRVGARLYRLYVTLLYQAEVLRK